MEESEEKQLLPKKRYHFRVQESTLEVVDLWYKQDHCSTYNEFIEKAILHYAGFLANEKNPNYLPSIVVSTLKSILKESDARQNRNLFRMAVELSMVMNILASQEGISEIALDRLRGDCITEVKKLNGVISMDTAVEWQNS